MSVYINDLTYTLAKRVPNMERGFRIETDYGYFFIEADEAEPIIKAVRLAIEKNLKIATAAKIRDEQVKS